MAMGSRETQRHEKVARGLGWFSIALGAAELAFPRRLARAIGAPPRTGLVRAMGAREALNGIAVLRSRQPAGPLWARVAGDAMDLALLGAAHLSPRARSGRLTAAAGMVAGVTALDVYAARRHSRERARMRGPVRIAQAITVNRPVDRVYTFWRDLQNLPAVLSHLESVRSIGDRRYHCVTRANGGSPLEWDAEIAQDQPNEHIEWRSLPSSGIQSAGRVRFVRAPGDRGTEVHVELEYESWAGGMGDELAKLFGRDAAQFIREDLRRFKQVLETGEVTRSDSTLRGTGVMQPAARPPREAPPLTESNPAGMEGRP
jgi:uncharacterized membrane protein